MLGKIIAINENVVSVKLEVNVYDFDGLIGKNVTFKDENITQIKQKFSCFIMTLIHQNLKMMYQILI